MTWTRLTVHWIVSDCDLRKVSVYTQSKGCVGLQVVWTIYRLEDTLRVYVLDHKGSWKEHLPLVEFATTILIRRVYGWHRMRHCMGGHVGHR